MPCTYDAFGSLRSDADHEELSKLTRMLCSLLEFVETRLESHPLRAVLTRDPELNAWWVEHKERDRVRREAEDAVAKTMELRRTAISKLTLEERKVLGIT